MWLIVIGVFVQIQPKLGFIKWFLLKWNASGRKMKYLRPSLSSWFSKLTSISHETPSALSIMFIDKPYQNWRRFWGSKKKTIIKFCYKLERMTISNFEIKSLSFQQTKPIFAENHVFILNLCHPRVTNINDTWPESFIYEIIKWCFTCYT